MSEPVRRERPILFSAPMVRAILAGRKTQTRRVITPTPTREFYCWSRPGVALFASEDEAIAGDEGDEVRSRHGVSGDRLWVRETWNTFDPGTDCPVPIARERWGKRAPWTGCEGDRPIEWTAVYRADGELEHPTDGPACWKPSIFMPRWASRITLEITEVRVQRLQEISDDDARAEGVEPYTPPHGHIDPDQRVPGPGFDRCRLGDHPHRLPFADLWDSINGKPRPMLDDDGVPVLDDNDRPIMIASRSWASNPWVWAITFRRLP